MSFSVEEILFGSITMPGESIRIALVLLGLLTTSYFDLFNRRNIPNHLLYGFLLASLALNFIFYDESIFIFSILVAIPLAIFGYVFYRFGQLGGADVFILLAINFAVPLHPSVSNIGTFNFPFIASIFVFSGVLFALYFLVSFALKLLKTNARPSLLAFTLFIPYLLLGYFYINSPLYSPVYFSFITIMVLSSVFFMAYRDQIYKIQAEKIPINKVEVEDVLALEIMDQTFVKKYSIKRLVTKEELAKLKKQKIDELWVYTKLPPFIPFLTLGFIASLFVSKYLLLF